MRVAIDARSIRPNFQGVGRHVLNLLLGLSQRESELEFLVLYSDPLAQRLVARSGGAYRGRFQWIKALSAPGSFLESVEIPWLLRIHRADLFHDIATTGVWTGNVPKVTTVHELSSQSQNDTVRKALRDARFVVAVSRWVAEELEARFNVSRPRLRVVYNAVAPGYMERVPENEVRAMRERFKLLYPYFLSVTTEVPRKNAELVQRVARTWKGSEQWIFTMLGLDEGNLRYLGVVEEAWLRPLYSACKAVIVPSRYEGFSLPPIEALATGSIPIVSDIPPHREMLGDILGQELFFDPDEPLSLERALNVVSISGESIRASVLEKFRLVRDRYSFLETAEQVQAVYREAGI